MIIIPEVVHITPVGRHCLKIGDFLKKAFDGSGASSPRQSGDIYVSGLPGTGRTTAIKRFLEEIANLEAVPSDWCYVNNFRDNYHPKVLQLPAGKAEEFQNDMNSLITEIKHELQQLFESEEYANRIDQLV